MPHYNYKKIDAFTSGNSLGNPAACIYLQRGQSLNDEEMLFIARQHQGFVSEMVYCQVDANPIHLTYYSSECEVDFCGHGTIACMYSLIRNNPALLKRPVLEIETRKKGKLAVYNKIKEENAVYIAAPKAQHIGTNLSRDEIAGALGIARDQISDQFPVDVINAGLATLIVPIGSLRDEISIFPDEKSLKAFCEQNEIDIILIFSKEVKDEIHFAHTRVFAPRFGYLEDPATGSGNSAFANYLLKNELWNGNPIAVEQGGNDRVFNIVRLMTDEGQVLFGGGAAERIVGEYYL
jgi:PhzF family phenazine biosynthesis protein